MKKIIQKIKYIFYLSIMPPYFRQFKQKEKILDDIFNMYLDNEYKKAFPPIKINE